jgi:hypothetical protein
MNDELSLFTTEQLVNELLSRPTFAAILIHSQDEVRVPQDHRKWVLCTTASLNLDQVLVLLTDTAKQVEGRVSS